MQWLVCTKIPSPSPLFFEPRTGQFLGPYRYHRFPKNFQRHWTTEFLLKLENRQFPKLPPIFLPKLFFIPNQHREQAAEFLVKVMTILWLRRCEEVKRDLCCELMPYHPDSCRYYLDSDYILALKLAKVCPSIRTHAFLLNS